MTNVLTLTLDEESQAFFERLRQRHFPPERNQIAAHLTLFHTLPDDDTIAETLCRAAESQAAFSMRVTGLRSLGKGVAFTLAAPALMALHARLASEFAEHLTAQDRQRLQPHVVVQNKVTPAAARELLGQLQASFVPMEAQACGMELWHYLGGPWELERQFPFTSAS